MRSSGVRLSDCFQTEWFGKIYGHMTPVHLKSDAVSAAFDDLAITYQPVMKHRFGSSFGGHFRYYKVA